MADSTALVIGFLISVPMIGVFMLSEEVAILKKDIEELKKRLNDAK